MPTIPVYRQQTSVSGVPNLGRVSGQAAGAVAAATTQLAGQVTRIADQQLEQFDNLRAEDAFNKLRQRQMDLMLNPEGGFLSRKGANAIAPDVIPSYEEQFTKAESEIEGTLQSERQRQLFKQRANAAGSEYRNALMRHVLNESNQYAADVFKGTLDVETNRAVTDWNNPYTINMSLSRIDAAVGREAQRQGLAPDATDALLRDARSKVHSSVLAAALENGNISYADEYLKQNKAQLSGVDFLKFKGAVTKEANTRVALGTATEVMQGFTAMMAPTEADQVINITMQTESGGRRFAPDGSVLTSPKGAKGEMQVMDYTNKDPGYGVRPAKDDSLEERARVGRDYMMAMVKEFDGDLGKAWAAYNAGPGATSNAIAKAEADGKPNEWLNYLPKETQDYVTKNLTAYRNGQGQPSRPTLEQVHAEVRNRLAGKDPDVVKLALDEATRQYDTTTKAIKQREDEALAQAYRILETNGGRYDALPASVKRAIPADKFGTVREFAAKVAKGEDIGTDWNTYYELKTNPGLLAQANLAAVKPLLGSAEFKDLVSDQAKLREGGGLGNQLLSDNQRLKLRMVEAGLDPNPKDKADAKKAGQVYAFIQQRIDAKQEATGKKLTPDEVNQEIDRAFLEVRVPGEWWGTNAMPLYRAETEGKPIVVPDTDRKQITDALKAAKQPVTEERIMALYKQARGLN